MRVVDRDVSNTTKVTTLTTHKVEGITVALTRAEADLIVRALNYCEFFGSSTLCELLEKALEAPPATEVES